jgi:hypothetical protein
MIKSHLHFGNAPKVYSRRFPSPNYATRAYKTDAELSQERTALISEIQTKFTTELEQRGYVAKDKVEEISKETFSAQFKDIPLEGLRALAKLDADGSPEIMKTLATQGAKILELENRGGGKESLSIRAQVKEWAERNKEAITTIVGGTKANLTPLEIRVNSPMTPSNTYSAGTYLPFPELLPGINEIVRPQPTFWDYIKKGSRNSAAIVFLNKTTPLGAAGFIGPGVAKPGISFQIESQTSAAKKIAASEKVAVEILQDIDGFATWLEQELSYQVRQKANLTLMSGAVSSTSPAGIQTLSVTFTQTGIATTNPNNWDALIACVAQLRAGNLMGNVTAFVNPIDYANMKLTKAISQGQPFIAPDPGVKIVEDNNIPVGYVQVAILDYYKVDIYKGYTVAYGWENDDFTKNLITVIGEMRIHQYFSTNYTGAFIYDTFANIKTAITAV